MIDIIFGFISAYKETIDNKIIDNHVLIIKNYLSGWFIVDFIAILPIDYLLRYLEINIQSYNYNRMLKILRIERLFKIK